jgi:hypothetical protein
MRGLMVLVLLAGCATAPSPAEIEAREVGERGLAQMRAVADRRPAYVEMCRGQMPTATEAGVDLCARRAMREDMQAIRHRTERLMDALFDEQAARRRSVPLGSVGNPVTVRPVQ